MTSRWNLKGKKALITGGSRGIGLAIANEFLQLGAEIFIISRNEEHLKQTINDWKVQGAKADGIAVDLSENAESVNVVTDKISSLWGELDILVNNVGINQRKNAQEYRLKDYSKIMDTNLTATFRLCQLTHPLLQRSSYPSIVNISSTSGVLGDEAGVPYGISKAGLIQLSKNINHAENDLRRGSLQGETSTQRS